MDIKFLTEFKSETEAKWRSREINPAVYGFQIQPDTKWNPGLSLDEIAQYEKFIGTQFPDDFRLMLQNINGTDLPNLNVYGNSGEPYQTAISLYAFPRDRQLIGDRIQYTNDDRSEIAEVLLEYEDFKLSTEAALVPIYGHRYLACESDRTKSRVLSIVGTDVITYGPCLKDYLTREFLT